GQGQGQGQGKGKGKGKGQPSPFATEGPSEEVSAEGTSSTVAKGDKVARSRQINPTRSRRGRSAVIQNYEKNLPPEFRKQVKAYLEAIAKQK
ncbi:MAG: hypothetical protein ABGZ19_08940, partial [Verrucomicrobiales bacterium]